MANTGRAVLEIERRFLVASLPSFGFGPGRLIVQGYLTTESPSVRVRWSEGKFFLTIKGEQEPDRPARLEVELDLHHEVGEALFRLAGDQVVTKKRYTLGRWELDVYQQALTGLVVLEIELANANEPLPPFPLGLVVIREITGERELDNSALAMLSVTEQRALVRQLYGENQTARL